LDLLPLFVFKILEASMENMSEMFRGYTLRETEQFTRQLQLLGDIKYLDEALARLMGAVSENPGQFDVIPGTTHLRFANARDFEREGIPVPPLRLSFSIEDDGVVLLESIKKMG
jgi:hypothetical protein